MKTANFIALFFLLTKHSAHTEAPIEIQLPHKKTASTDFEPIAPLPSHPLSHTSALKVIIPPSILSAFRSMRSLIERLKKSWLSSELLYLIGVNRGAMTSRLKECSIWKKNRIAARLLLKPIEKMTPREKKCLISFSSDPEVTDRLLEQGMDYIKARPCRIHS